MFTLGSCAPDPWAHALLTPGPYCSSWQPEHKSYICKGKGTDSERGYAGGEGASEEVEGSSECHGDRGAEISRAGRVGGDGNGESGAAEAAPDLRQDVRPEKLGIEKHSPPARCPLGWDARPRLTSRRAQLAAPRG